MKAGDGRRLLNRMEVKMFNLESIAFHLLGGRPLPVDKVGADIVVEALARGEVIPAWADVLEVAEAVDLVSRDLRRKLGEPTPRLLILLLKRGEWHVWSATLPKLLEDCQFKEADADRVVWDVTTPSHLASTCAEEALELSREYGPDALLYRADYVRESNYSPQPVLALEACTAFLRHGADHLEVIPLREARNKRFELYERFPPVKHLLSEMLAC